MELNWTVIGVGVALASVIITAQTCTNSQITSLRTDVREDISSLRTDVRGDISSLRTDVRGDVSSLRTHVREELTSLRTETASLRSDIAGLRNRVGVDQIRLVVAPGSPKKALEEFLTQKLKGAQVQIEVQPVKTQPQKK